MNNTKTYYLSDEIDPMDWESVSDAYNDLAVYAYKRIDYLSSIYPIPEELIGDAVLMACEKAFRYADRFDGNIGKLHNWFNAIIKNCIHDIHNKQHDNMVNNDDNHENDSVDIGTSPEHTMVVEEVMQIREEVAEALKNHIDNLRPLDREIFMKAFVDDLPYKVIAAQTGLTETAARKRAFDIKKRIRKDLPDITSWKLTDIIIYCQEAKLPSPHSVAEYRLLEHYPQYDPSKLEPEYTNTFGYEEEVEAHTMLSSYLEMCFDDYKRAFEKEGDLFPELLEELRKRGRTVTSNEQLGPDFFIIEDDLDLILSCEYGISLYIGFTHEFILIECEEADATSICDFIDDLHPLIDLVGEEIDSIIDIRS